jgi:hypothetical protein
MLVEFREAVEFHHFGHRRVEPGRKRRPLNPGKLTDNKAAAKTRLKKFARLAYRETLIAAASRSGNVWHGCFGTPTPL